jgi:uncharacterized protein YjbJ (UPF0337 family)
MNSDQLKGKWTQFKGEVRRKYGKLTEDDLQIIAGDYEKYIGKVQERYGDRKAEIMEWTEKWFSQAQQPKEHSGSRGR